MDQNEHFFFGNNKTNDNQFKLFFTTNEVEDCGWCTIKNDVNENNVRLIIICPLNKM